MYDKSYKLIINHVKIQIENEMPLNTHGIVQEKKTYQFLLKL
jgi:hypothetical protein